MQFHPLGTIGKLNALAATCTTRARKRGWHCRRGALAKAADRLIDLGVTAGPTLRFEYLFAFGGGRPGWAGRGAPSWTSPGPLCSASGATRRRRAWP